MLLHLTLLATVLLGTVSTENIISFNTVQQPNIDYQSFNDQLSILGNFDSISFYDYEGQSNDSTTGEKNLYLINDESQFRSLYSYNGSIHRFEKISSDSILMVGDFKINDNYTSPVIFNSTRNEFIEIGGWEDHVDGDIITIFYDEEEDLIYFGGDLSYDNEIFGLVIYDLSKQRIVDSPFRGFDEDGYISSILKIIDDNDEGSIIFGGNFNSLGDKNLLIHQYQNHTITHHNHTTNSSNTTISVDPENIVSLKYAIISSVNTDESVSDKVDSIICPDNEASWLLTEQNVGSWTASLPFDVNPTKLRLFNSLVKNSGVEYFRVITSPTNGIMNLTYIDPVTQEQNYCDAWCPLLNNTYLNDITTDMGSDFYSINSTLTTGTLGFGSRYQEFGFVNSVSVESVTLQVMSAYGDRAGLSGFQLFQSGILTYANDTLNEPNCDQISSLESSLIGKATWETFKDQDGTHLTTTVGASTKDKVGITFYPNVTYSGDYSVLFFTPGCKYDNTCSSRGIVNVTLINGNGDYLTSELLYQNNEEQKYDTIYTGHLDVDDAVPYIDMIFDSTINSDSDEVVIVADRVQLNLLSVDQIYYHNDTNTTTVKNSSLELSIPLNGIFEYSLRNFSKFDTTISNVSTNGSTNVYVGNSTINLIGSQLLSENAHVNSLANINNTLYVAGEFESKYGNNLIGVSLNGYNTSSNSVKVQEEEITSGGGTNGPINALYTGDNNSLIIVGDFNKTLNSTDIQKLNSTVSSNSILNIALYDGKNWSSFANGTIDADISTFANLTFNGIEYFIFSNGDDNFTSFQVWDNSNDYWDTDRNNLNVSLAVKLLNYTIAAGQISNFGLTKSQGGAYVSDPHLSFLPFELSPGLQYYSALFLNKTANVFGGQFNTTDNKIQNLIIVDNSNSTSGIDDIEWDYDSKVITIFKKDDYLYIGLENGAKVNDDDHVDGVIIYDLQNSSLPVQPASLSNDGNVRVNSIAATDDVLYVGGEFTHAGSLSCEGICSYLLKESRWSNPFSSSSQSISGTVNQMSFYSSTEMLVSGVFKLGNNNNAKFATFDTKENSIVLADQLNNGINTTEIKSFILVDQDSISKRIIVMGDRQLEYYNGQNWTLLTDDLNLKMTNFTGIQLIDLNDTNSQNDESIFNKDQILMVTGIISHKAYGNFSTGFYNGTAWIPYLFTNSGSTTNVVLQNKQATTSSTTSTYSLKSKVMKVRNVVGVGFACALCSLLLVILAYLAYYFLVGKNKIYSKPLEARVAEKDMLLTVPPNQLIDSLDHAKYMAE